MVLVWLIHLGFVGWLIRQFYQSQRNAVISKYFWYGVSLKLLGGIAYGLFYQGQIQGGDTWTFFENSRILAQWGTSNFHQYLWALVGGSVPEELIRIMGYETQPRALFMAKTISVFTIITGGSYWLTGLYLSLFSFTGIWTLVERIAVRYGGSKKAALAAFIFLPSALFWGAGVSKEAIYYGGFGFLAAWFWPYFHLKLRPVQWVLAILLLLLLFQLKYYYVAVLVPVLIATLLELRLFKPHDLPWLAGLRWVALFLLLVFGVSWLHPNLRFHHLAEVVRSNSELLAQISSSNALIKFSPHPDPLVWMGMNLPWATFTGLLRPNFGDWGSVYQNLAVFEHLVIALFLLAAVVTWPAKHIQQIDWLPCLVYVLILAGILTLSTPNFGTLVRFKISYLPVFVFMVLYKNKLWDRLVSKLP
jgi:hypothetical protein